MTPTNFKDLTGRRFGRLTVIRRAENGKNYQTKWLCRCDCGNEVSVYRGNLKRGHTKSCGCLSVETVVNRSVTHGESKTRLWNVWASMVGRCEYESNTDYKWYGGRGIKVCDAWKNYKNFRDWMLSNGYDPLAPRGKCTIDRIDVNGNYCPENCRVVPMSVQAKNRRNTRKVC